MFRRIACVPVLVLALATPGCGDDPAAPDPPLLDGFWSGTSQDVTLELTLEEREPGAIAGTGGISGSGSLRTGTGADAVTVTSGTRVEGHVSFTLSREGGEDLNYTGDFVNDFTIEGSLTGGQFNDFPLELNRRPLESDGDV